ncbi:MAG: tetratricopeptide repeat protein [Gammaproteobacteria bacterium]|nr:MAG: tetratricopeptide repeat protein [Gammaproteobacteria bacterium]
MSLIDNLENMLAAGKDSAMLRFGLGSAYYHERRYAEAIPHLKQCLAMDENYTAAYKLLGRALHKQDQSEEALQILSAGLDKSVQSGDKQTEREIRVFLKKLQRH